MKDTYIFFKVIRLRLIHMNSDAKRRGRVDFATIELSISLQANARAMCVPYRICNLRRDLLHFHHS